MRQEKEVSKIIICFFMLVVLSLSGCATSGGGHAGGYEDGRKGVEKKSLSQGYLDDYENGRAAAYYYNLGYSDAQAGRKPQYLEDLDYTKGYEEGKEAIKEVSETHIK